MNTPRIRADLLLLTVTILWGSAFVVMRVAADHGSIFFLNGSRFLLGGIILLPFVKFRSSFSPGGLIAIIYAGIALFVAVSLQQAGLATTTAGNAGFITSLSVVIVPLILWIGWREQPTRWLAGSILLAVAGAYLLSAQGSLDFKPGDLYILAGSFFWAGHIVIVGKGQQKIAPIPFAFGQFIVCGALGLVVGVFLETPTITQVRFFLPAIIFTGIISIAIGFTLQVHAQKHTPPTDAALILGMEGVFAAIFGRIFLEEKLDFIQGIGCAMILAAVLLSQLRPEMVKYFKRSADPK